MNVMNKLISPLVLLVAPAALFLFLTPTFADTVVGRSSLKLDHALFSAATQPDESVKSPPKFGAKGSWWWSLGMAGGVVGDTDGDINANFQFHTFLIDNVEMGLEFGGTFFNDVKGTDSVGGGFNLNFRWHFIHKERFTIFAEGGAGIQGTSNEVPFGGSEFNFTPRAGMGLTWQMFPDKPMRVMLGSRWQHVSNAGTQGGSNRNPGRDTGVIYLSLIFPF